MSFYHDFAQPAMIALARAGNRGVLVDVPLRNKLVAEKKQEFDATVARLADTVGRPINPDSPKQVQTLLYEDLKLPVQRKRPKGGKGVGAVTSDEEAIKALRRIAPQHSEVLTLVLDCRGLSKDVSSLMTPLETRSDGQSYFVTTYNATGTVTGRVSSSAPIHTDAGGNMQNQKRGPTRRMFVARPGHVLVKGDGSQAEARVVAALMHDEDWLAKFRDPAYDVHVDNVTLIHGVTHDEALAEARMTPEERVVWRRPRGIQTADVRDSLRQQCKPITHGAHYKAGPRAVSKIGDIPFHEAKWGLEKYTRARPRLAQWWSRVESVLQTTRTLRTIWGRVRVFMGRLNDQTLREAVAHEPQSTVGDLINHAFFRLDLDGDGVWYPLIQAHDEVVLEVPEAHVTEAVDRLRHWLEYPLAYPWLSQPLVIPAEIKVGTNWFDMKGV